MGREILLVLTNYSKGGLSRVESQQKIKIWDVAIARSKCRPASENFKPNLKSIFLFFYSSLFYSPPITNSDIRGNGLGRWSMAEPHSRQFGLMLRKQNHQRPIPPDARIHGKLGSPHPKGRSSSWHRPVAYWKDGQHANPQVASRQQFHPPLKWQPFLCYLTIQIFYKDFVTMVSLTFPVLDPTLFRSPTNALKVINTVFNGN